MVVEITLAVLLELGLEFGLARHQGLHGRVGKHRLRSEERGRLLGAPAPLGGDTVRLGSVRRAG